MSNIYFQQHKILLDNNIHTFERTQTTDISTSGLHTLFNLPSTTLAFYYINCSMDMGNEFMRIYLGQTNKILSGRNYTYGYIFCINQHIGTLYNDDGNINSQNTVSDSLTLYGGYGYGGYIMTTHVYGFYVA